MKRILLTLCALVMILTGCVPAFAASEDRAYYPIEVEETAEGSVPLLVHEIQYQGVGRICIDLAGIKGMEAPAESVHERLSQVIRELTSYKEAVGPLPGRAKKKSQQPER